MEELLPLIIGIVWVVYSLYSRGQKKKTGRKPQPAKANKAPSLLEQILSGQGISVPEPEESDVDFEYEYEEEPINVVEERVNNHEPLPFLNAELKDVKEEGGSGLKNYFDSEEIADTDEDESDWEFIEELKSFDIKKAIIYSEILNAPYIDYK